MAHGLLSSTNGRGNLNLSSLVAEKIKNAAAMSAEERKAREQEIGLLREKVDAKKATQEDIVRLQQLEGQDKERKEGGIGKSFFAKAVMSEFGGDRRRRLMGTFSKDPDATRDPSLTKEQRFSALLDRAARPSESPVTPAAPVEDDIRPEEYGDAIYQKPTPQQGALEKLLETIKSQYNIIETKVNALGSEEKKNVASKKQNNSHLSRVTGVLESLKDYFNKDNDLKSIENNIEREKLDAQRDSLAQSKLDSEELSLEGGSDRSDLLDTDTLEEQDARKGDKGGGLLGGIMRGIGGLMKNFGGKKGGTQYTKPIGPQPMNSSTPWATKGIGDRGGMFGSQGFTPRLSSSPVKMAEGGGIVDNPTVTNLPPGSSVIPLNRNNALGSMFKQAGQGEAGSKLADPMSQVMQLPTQVGGGLLLTLLGKLMNKLGGLGSMVGPVIAKIATPVASMFGLPATIASSILGGPAAAATTKPKKKSSGFLDNLKSLLGRRSGGATSPGVTPTTGGADLGSSMRAGETIQAQSNEGPGGFIQGGSGQGSEGGQNTTGGYATHYHLSPPSNDAAGWAEARSVALTSAQMMLNRGSTIYFGNIKEFAQPATLADQIAREQQAHTQPGRTQGGIDMQEKSSTGSMRMKFPLKVTNVSQDISGGSGRTARIIGSNVRLAHGAVGSANSVETAAMPQVAQQPPVALPGSSNPQTSRPEAPQVSPSSPPPDPSQASNIFLQQLARQQSPQQKETAVQPRGLSYLSVTDPTSVGNLYWYKF